MQDTEIVDIDSSGPLLTMEITSCLKRLKALLYEHDTIKDRLRELNIKRLDASQEQQREDEIKIVIQMYESNYIMLSSMVAQRRKHKFLSY